MSVSVPRRRFVFFRVVMALMLREMSTTYGRSPGGYVWAIAEPVGGIVIFTVVLSFIARTPPLGDNFPLFFATGIMPFMLYQSLSNKVGTAIRYSRQLLSYPNVTFMDAIVARLILNALTEIVVFGLVVSGIIIAFGLHLNLDYLKIFRSFGMAIALGTGVGLANCYLMSMFPIWQFVWAVLNRPLFLISGIFFLIDELPEAARDLLLWNPAGHVIMMMRAGIYDTYGAAYVSEPYVYMLSVVLAALGMLLLHRYHRIIMDEGA
ncbi:ABC transporter permease [Rhodobacter sp. TJ_12]|uniref:ABC transporter permease n=1 Tax=Rhodobacter sp. TJ_12 TaxID=2029399 RepID=UPI001CBC5218|nr:ABC transporter permease [Rhodobacter sp. TJ_12]